MVVARTRFLSQGYYDPLLNSLIEILNELKINSLVDLGCGEGYYTNPLQIALNIPIVGIDLSKTALKTASKANHHVEYALANITKCPLDDQASDAVLSIFSPYDYFEAQRIAQRYLIVVRPGPKHLIELKAVLYECVVENPIPDLDYPQSRCILEKTLNFKMNLKNESLNDLLMMTPYSHTSPQNGLQKVRELKQLSVSAHFHISVFQFLHAS